MNNRKAPNSTRCNEPVPERYAQGRIQCKFKANDSLCKPRLPPQPATEVVPICVLFFIERKKKKKEKKGIEPAEIVKSVCAYRQWKAAGQRSSFGNRVRSVRAVGFHFQFCSLSWLAVFVCLEAQSRASCYTFLLTARRYHPNPHPRLLLPFSVTITDAIEAGTVLFHRITTLFATTTSLHHHSTHYTASRRRSISNHMR